MQVFPDWSNICEGQGPGTDGQAYLASLLVTEKVSPIALVTGVNLIKLFWRKFNHTFCKIDHFMNICNICSIAKKRSSLQKRVSKFKPKNSFLRLTPGLDVTKLFLCH